MWLFKNRHTTPHDALRQNRRAALFIFIGIVCIACAAYLDAPPYRILLAAPTMPDKIFARSVVVVMRRGLATQGVILNRPLTPEQAAQLPAALHGQVSNYGGPVNFPDKVAMLAWRPQQPADFSLILADSRAFGDADVLPAQIAQLQAQGYRVRLFAGYAGWSPLQLEMEKWPARMWQSYPPASAAAQLNSLFDGSGTDWAALRESR